MYNFAKEIFNQNFSFYMLIGIFNSIFGYVVIFSLMFAFYITPEISNFIGYCAGFVVSYFLNKKFNFRSKNSPIKEFPKFILSMGIAYVVNLLILLVCYRILCINKYVSQLIAGIAYILIGYSLSKYYVFRLRRIYEVE